MMVDLLDNSIPLVFLSDVFYWRLNNHPIANILINNLPIFNDYFVENFYSSLRSQTVESNSTLQIIQKAKIINTEKNNNLSFKESFINSRNLLISQDKLNYLEKKVFLFLFSLFDKINNNIYSNFILISFKINVDVKILLLAWNTKIKPTNNKFCNAEECLFFNNLDSSNGIVLICDHNFYKDYLTLYNGKCNYFFSYLSLEITKNIKSLTKRLTTLLKENEKSLVKKDVDDDLNENNDENNDENIQSI